MSWAAIAEAFAAFGHSSLVLGAHQKRTMAVALEILAVFGKGAKILPAVAVGTSNS